MKSLRLTICVLTLSLFFLTGCGKFGSPLPPEALSPEAVNELLVTAQLGEVRFAWSSPENDRRGEELKFIDGYRVYRAEIERFEDYVEDPVEASEEIGFLEDRHILERDRLRLEAEEKGLPTRKVKVDGAMKEFSFVDRDLSAGKEYVYMIVPTNQGGVEGEVLQYVRILYRGDSSEIRFVDQKTIGVEL